MMKRIFGNTLAQGVGLAIAFLDRFLVVGLLLRAWGTEVYSDWAVLLSCVGMLSLGELGLNIYYGNVMQQAYAIGDERLFARTVAIALSSSFGVASLLGILGWILVSALDIPASLQLVVTEQQEALVVLSVMGLATLSRIARGAVSQILRGRQQFLVGVLVDQVFLASLVVGMLAGAALAVRPVTMAALYFACDLCFGWGITLWVLGRRCPLLRLVPVLPRASELSDIARHVRWLGIQQAFPTAWLQLPILILSQLGSTGASLVSLIVLRTLVNFARTIGTMISIGAGVETAAVQHRVGEEHVLRIVHATGHVLAVVSVLVAAGILNFGPTLLHLWTGHSEYFSLPILAPLLVGSVAAAPSASLYSHLMLTNKQRPVSLAVLVQLVVGLGTCAALAPGHGVVGAALGLCLGEAIGQGVVLPMCASRDVPRLEYARYLKSAVGAMLPAALWSWAIGWVVTKVLFAGATWWQLVVGGALWVAVGVFPIVWLLIPQAHRLALWQRLCNRQAWSV